MSLAQDLSYLTQRLQMREEAQGEEETLDRLPQAIAWLTASGTVENAVQSGEMIPDFELTDSHGRIVNLQSLLDRGPAVITFYLDGQCPYCQLALRSLQEALPDINAAGASLLAISLEPPHQAVATVRANALTFPVLSDPGGRIGRLFGLVYRLPSDLIEGYRQIGVRSFDFEAESGLLPLAATYVVDETGIAAYAFVDPDPTQRAEPAILLAALNELRSQHPQANAMPPICG